LLANVVIFFSNDVKTACVSSLTKYLWKNLEEPEFDVAEFDKLFSKAPAKVKPATSKSSEIKKVKVVSFADTALCRSYASLFITYVAA